MLLNFPFPTICVQLKQCHLVAKHCIYICDIRPCFLFPHHMCPTLAVPSSRLPLHICCYVHPTRWVHCAAAACIKISQHHYLSENTITFETRWCIRSCLNCRQPFPTQPGRQTNMLVAAQRVISAILNLKI